MSPADKLHGPGSQQVKVEGPLSPAPDDPLGEFVFSVPTGIVGLQVLVFVAVLYQGIKKDSTKLKLQLPSGHFWLPMPAVYQVKKGVPTLAKVMNPNYHEKLELPL